MSSKESPERKGADDAARAGSAAIEAGSASRPAIAPRQDPWHTLGAQLGNRAFAALASAVASATSPEPAATTSLRVGDDRDALEDEGRRVADMVLGPPPPPAPPTPGAPPADGPPTRGAAVAAAVSPSLRATVAGMAHGHGSPLPAAPRAFMESRFGRDFSQVRVHADAGAAASAASFDARAYTVGADVVFGEGRFQPETPTGQRLLAHELTHVAQQGFAPLRREVARVPGAFLHTQWPSCFRARPNAGARVADRDTTGAGFMGRRWPVDKESAWHRATSVRIEEYELTYRREPCRGLDAASAIPARFVRGRRSFASGPSSGMLITPRPTARLLEQGP